MTKLLAVVIALWLAIPAAGQSTGANVAGLVIDESGARMPGASVTITHVQNGRSVTVTTGNEGEYRVVALLPGEYDLAVTQSGFAQVTRRAMLRVGADATANFRLPIATVDVRTTVTADSPARRAGTIATIVERHQGAG